MPTFTAGQFELQSASILATHTGDRPSFQADVSRGWFGSRHFQVFAMPQGLLFLEMHLKDYGNLGGGGPSAAGIFMMTQFGALGGLAAGLAAARDAERYGSRPEDKWETGLDALTEDELLDLAKSRRKSFVSKIGEISAVSIDAPGGFRRALGDSTLQGTITLRDRTLGKVTMEIRDAAAMSVAVDALPRRLGNRVQVNVKFDQQSMRFVPR
jgi:hypothetical protein